MKKEASENIFRAKGVPKLTEAQLENLKRLAERPDDEIDYSDIPEITDFSGFEVGKFIALSRRRLLSGWMRMLFIGLSVKEKGIRRGSMRFCGGRWNGVDGGCLIRSQWKSFKMCRRDSVLFCPCIPGIPSLA